MAIDAKKARRHYLALREQARVVDVLVAKNNWVVDDLLVRQVAESVRGAETDLPGVVPPLSKDQLYERGGTGQYASSLALQGYLSRAMGALRAELDDADAAPPPVQKRDFTFIENADLRRILERDYVDANTSFMVRSWKATIVLAGGAIEAVLLDLLMRNEARAKSIDGAPSKPLDRWDLNELIRVAVALELVGPGVEKHSDSLRQYRNLVHPGNEIRSKLRCEQEEARIALSVLEIIHRDLSG